MDTLPTPPSGDERELDIEDAFGEHDIEYWVWSGNRLVPATPDQIVIIREREALARLRAWNDREMHAERGRSRRDSFLQVIGWLRGLPTRIIPAFAARFSYAQPKTSDSPPDLAQTGTSADRPAPERSAP